MLLACTPAANALGLPECYQAAVAHDSQFASAQAAHRGGVEVLSQARAQLGTTVQLSGAVGALRDQPTGQPAVGGRTTQAGIQVSQPLIHAADFIAKDQARHQVTRSDAQFSGAQQDLFLRVAQAYFSALLAQDEFDLTFSEKESISRQLAEAQRAYEVGTGTVTDMNDARARYELSAATEIGNRGELEVARRALEILTGIPVTRVDGVPENAPLKEPEPSDVQYWINAAERRNLSVLQAQETANVQRLEIDRSRSVIYPTVDVVASYNRYSFSQSSLNPMNVDRSAEIGIQVTMALWDGGLRNSRIRQALAGSEQAQNDLQTARRAAAQSARQAYVGVSSAVAQYRALAEAAAAARSSFEGNLQAKAAGYRTALDVLNARQTLFQTRRQMAAVRYSAILALLQLKQTAGEISEADLSGLTSPQAAPATQ